MSPRDDTQKDLHAWVEKCFGPEAHNPKERALRFLEEALELAQAMGLGEGDVSRMRRYVWARPIGEVSQEIGGVMVTLYGLAEVMGISVETEENREIARVLHPAFVEKIRRKHALKVAAGICS